MSCTNPISAQSYYCPATGLNAIRFKAPDFKPNLELPCNKCKSCKLRKAKEWALRLWHESQMHEQNSYVTFTYADQNLPDYQDLEHRDWQLFIKRLRKSNPTQNITYFMCGEYGDATHRPHFHAILFGYYPPDAVYHRTEKGNRYYKSADLDRHWRQGFTDTSNVSYKNAGYVARYTLKKQLASEELQDRYTYLDVNGDLQTRRFEYVRMSTGREPGNGIGASWFHKNHLNCIEQDLVRDPNGFACPIPRYYLNILRDLYCEDTFDFLAKRRLEKARANPDNSPDRLRQKAVCAEAKVKLLPRPYL